MKARPAELRKARGQGENTCGKENQAAPKTRSESTGKRGAARADTGMALTCYAVKAYPPEDGPAGTLDLHDLAARAQCEQAHNQFGQYDAPCDPDRAVLLRS